MKSVHLGPTAGDLMTTSVTSMDVKTSNTGTDVFQTVPTLPCSCSQTAVVCSRMKRLEFVRTVTLSVLEDA